jgi:hypothetical protein
MRIVSNGSYAVHASTSSSESSPIALVTRLTISDQILQAAEKKAAAALPPASTSAGPASSRPIPAPLQRPGATSSSRSIGPGIASTAPTRGPAAASNLAQTYRQMPASSMRPTAPTQGPPPGAFRQDSRGAPPRPQPNGQPPMNRPPPNGYDPRDPRDPRNARSAPARGPPPPHSGRMF